MSEPEAVGDSPSQLGRVRTIEDLHAIMRTRAQYLDVTLQSIGRAALLPTRYANKLLAPNPTKKLGILSLPSLMEALQIELIVVVRTDVPKRITDKLDKRRVRVSERAVRQVRMLSKRFLRSIAKKGGRARADKMGVRARRKAAQKAGRARQSKLSPVERKLLAQRASLVRWSRVAPSGSVR